MGMMAGFSFGPNFQEAQNVPVSFSADLTFNFPVFSSLYPNDRTDFLFSVGIYPHISPMWYLGVRGGASVNLANIAIPILLATVSTRYFTSPQFFLGADMGLAVTNTLVAAVYIGWAPF
jgi:hypothetical protein